MRLDRDYSEASVTTFSTDLASFYDVDAFSSHEFEAGTELEIADAFAVELNAPEGLSPLSP